MDGGLRERLATLSRGELVGLLVVVGLTLSGAVVWYLRSLPEPVAISTNAAASMQGEGGSGPTADEPVADDVSPSPMAEVIVDVAGWVQDPGVYEFSADARAIDALERAGGARKGADLEAINLAALLVDGEQLVVPGPSKKHASEAESINGTSTSDLIDVNSAEASELETLPGVGEVIAARIVEHREANGPFQSPQDLMDVSGIGEVTFAEMEAEVTV